MKALTQGGNAPIGAPSARVAVGWAPERIGNLDVDASAFLLKADGKVRSAAVDPASPASAQRLVDASLEAVRQWTFQPERVAGHGVPGTQSLPVCFSLSLVGSHAAIPPCEWNAPGKHAPIGEGESVALNPAARLVNDVAGHAL